jgi:hypothetical protein
MKFSIKYLGIRFMLVALFAPYLSASEVAPATARARVISFPSLDAFYPQSMEKSGIAGAAVVARVCVDANSKIAVEPMVITGSFYPVFDKAVVKMLQQGKYAAGVVDGTPVAGCTDLAVYGALAKKISGANKKAIARLVDQLNSQLPIVDGDLEIADVRSTDDKIVWKKVLWKATAADYASVDLQGVYDQYRKQEYKLYCESKTFRTAFEAGVSVVSWYSTSDGKRLFGIVTNDESCPANFALAPIR